MPEYDYSGQGLYFITLCSFKKLPLFGEVADGVLSLNDLGRAVVEVWEGLPQRFPQVTTDAHVVMPNHLHGVLVITDADRSGQGRRTMLLPKVVGYLKMNAAKRINAALGRKGVPVWQRNYYERIVRNHEELAAVREYVAANPRNWGEDPDR